MQRPRYAEQNWFLQMKLELLGICLPASLFVCLSQLLYNVAIKGVQLCERIYTDCFQMKNTAVFVFFRTVVSDFLGSITSEVLNTITTTFIAEEEEEDEADNALETPASDVATLGSVKSWVLSLNENT